MKRLLQYNIYQKSIDYISYLDIMYGFEQIAATEKELKSFLLCDLIKIIKEYILIEVIHKDLELCYVNVCDERTETLVENEIYRESMGAPHKEWQKICTTESEDQEEKVQPQKMRIVAAIWFLPFKDCIFRNFDENPWAYLLLERMSWETSQVKTESIISDEENKHFETLIKQSEGEITSDEIHLSWKRQDTNIELHFTMREFYYWRFDEALMILPVILFFMEEILVYMVMKRTRQDLLNF
jgi:hypothetical protein